MSSKPPVEVGVFGALFLALAVALALLVPAMGAWVTSSIGTYLNAPFWAAVVAAVLLFPVLPLAWDAWANVRRRRRIGAKAPMSPIPRIMLRVVFLNVLAIGLLLAFAPKLVFTALSTRGDWMLEGRSGPLANKVREDLFWGADRIEWLYALASSNKYEAVADAPVVAETKPEVGTLTSTAVVAPPIVEAMPSVEVAPSVEPAPVVLARPVWPLPSRPHALIGAIPAASDTDYASVARYIAEHEPNPYQRMRAIHDYVATRVAYDVEGLQPNKYPSYEPKDVFDRRMGVCAGYANLVQAMVETIGGKSIIIAGFSREASSTLGNGDHVWNAVEIEGQWYLMDVTWDAGSVGEGKFEPQYRADYLFTPPEIFVQTHFPALPQWQLLDEPVSRGDFMRQPLLNPGFYANGLKLISPLRSQFTVNEAKAKVVLSNTRGTYLIVRAEPARTAELSDRVDGPKCDLTYSKDQANIECPLGPPGKYRLVLFGSGKALGSQPYLGHFEVNYQ